MLNITARRTIVIPLIADTIFGFSTSFPLGTTRFPKAIDFARISSVKNGPSKRGIELSFLNKLCGGIGEA